MRKRREFLTAYKIIFQEMEDDNPYFHRNAGYIPYIAFPPGRKGNLDYLLDALILLTEADRSLSLADKAKSLVLTLAPDGQVYKSNGYIRKRNTLVTIKEDTATFSRN